MSDPPSRDSDNIRRALLRDPAVTGGEPSEVRADVRQRYDIPGPSADVRGGPHFRIRGDPKSGRTRDNPARCGSPQTVVRLYPCGRIKVGRRRNFANSK